MIEASPQSGSASVRRQDDMPTLSNDEVRKGFARAFGEHAAAISEMAKFFRVVEQRGMDWPPEITVDMAKQLREVSAGTLLPEVVFACMGEPGKLNAFRKLHTSEQKRLVRDGSAVVVAQNGVATTKSLNEMTAKELHKIVDPSLGKLRSADEQVARFVSASASEVRKATNVDVTVTLSYGLYQKLVAEAAENGMAPRVFVRHLVLRAISDAR